MAQAARRRNPRGQGQVLRDQLVEATARLLATMDRPETLTLRQVAREVGVAPASIYGHFPDLTALIEHVLKLRYDELGRLMNDAAADAATPLAELVARCASYVHWGVGHPGEYRTIVGGAMPEQLGPLNAHGAGEELLNALVRALAAAAVPGGEPLAMGKESTAAEQWQAGLILWTGLHGLVSLYNSHGNVPWPALDDLLAQLLGLHTGRSKSEIEDIMAGGATAS
ncbi:TetR/AcrR family transcriptional regulator [Catenulispora sp. NL8]|uniref:TetR/AcrR family transcriptional regulator n=1 Tax=Catenulispora pinistramenti TaxID=2705254 RepID=A0ABS5L8D3_9ACTN|nr:TetR/AcrR family transcriptional regulator [Catenulispora pinistramenti]MBS2554615.1 TetR/AcrR family transcriptional regulator [Catenulispora pinistramenti]